MISTADAIWYTTKETSGNSECHLIRRLRLHDDFLLAINKLGGLPSQTLEDHIDIQSKLMEELTASAEQNLELHQ